MSGVLCLLGLHSWRDVSRGSTQVVVEVCRRACGARRERFAWQDAWERTDR